MNDSISVFSSIRKKSILLFTGFGISHVKVAYYNFSSGFPFS